MSAPHEPDVGDVVDPTAPDPTPEEVTNHGHADFVEPFTGATPIDEEEVTG